MDVVIRPAADAGGVGNMVINRHILIQNVKTIIMA
jgi:hypothetical protein